MISVFFAVLHFGSESGTSRFQAGVRLLAGSLKTARKRRAPGIWIAAVSDPLKELSAKISDFSEFRSVGSEKSPVAT